MKARSLVLAVAVVISGVFLLGSAALSHPPTSLDLDYSADGGVLSISIAHSVGDVSTHFIESVKVKVDGRQAAELFYIQQGEKSGEKILVTIGNFDPGTEVSVEAECNKFGKIDQKMTL